MKKINISFIKTIAGMAVFAIMLVITGCNPEDEMGSIYNPEYIGNRPAPVVDSIGALNDGASAKLAGVAQYRIYGKNFSGAMNENLVQFGEVKGILLNASPTQLDVQVPYLVSDSIVMRVSVHKALAYSNTKIMQLKDPVVTITSDKFFVAKSMAIDKAGNIFASLVNNVDSKIGIKKLDIATGTYTDFFAPSAMPVTFWNSMKFGPDGSLYCVGAQRRIAVIPAAGGSTAPATYASFPSADGVTVLNDLDFDASKTIWTGGLVSGNKIYSVDLAKTITSFDFKGTVRALKVYNGYLYVASRRDSTDKIYRLKINSSSSLGAEELYSDIGAKYGPVIITSLTFSSEGFLYVGLDRTPGMVLVNPGGAALADFYPSVLQPAGTFNNSLKYSSFIWGKDNYLYVLLDRSTSATTSELKVLKINAVKTGAPSYGIQ